MSGDLATDLATDLAVDLATDLAPGGFVDVPEQLSALLHYDPHVVANVDIGTGVSDFRPVVGSQTLDVVSQPTPSAQPTYNTPSPTLASGRNSISYDNTALQRLFGTAQASVAALNGVSPFTMCVVVVHSDVSISGSACVVQNTATPFNRSHVYNASGTPGRTAARYRSPALFTNKTMGAAELLANGVPAWAIIDFDGVNTISIETSAGVRGSFVGAAGVSQAGLDSVVFGGDPGVGYHAGEIGDWVLFSRYLDAPDRAAMITWLGTRL